MRYAHILNAVMQRPWLITPDRHAAIVELINSKLGKSSLEYFAERPKEDFFGDPLEQMTFDPMNRLAIIPVKGIMGKRLSLFEKSCGCVDSRDVAEDLESAVAMGAEKIILDVDSPGGMVDGTKELAEKISEMQSNGPAEIHAFTEGQMCSAAYWISSGARMIHATEMSEVGSIGVYMPWIDQTKRFEMAGLRVELIKAGKHKGAGYPGTALSDDVREMWQADVDRIYEKFKAHVTSCRSSVKDETMQGQCFIGEIAATNGLVDNLVKGIEDLKNQLRK